MRGIRNECCVDELNWLIIWFYDVFYFASFTSATEKMIRADLTDFLQIRYRDKIVIL